MPSQLRMRLPSLSALPPLGPLPIGYVLDVATRADAQGVANCLSDAFSDPTWTAERVRTELLEAQDVELTRVVRVGRTVAATASFQRIPSLAATGGVVHWVGTHSDHMGQRLGQYATLAVLHDMAAAGCDQAFLTTDDHRLAALRIYLDMGFEPDIWDVDHPTRWKVVREALGR